MLVAATIALIVVALGVLVLVTRKSPSTHVLEAITEEGEDAAREELDRRLPPISSVRPRDIRHLSERFAGLGLLGHTAALRVELAMFDDEEIAIPARAVGLLGLQLRGPDRDALEELGALALEDARRPGNEGERTGALLALARCLHGTPLTPQDNKAVLRVTKRSGLLTQALIGRVIALAIGETDETQELPTRPRPAGQTA